MKRDPMRLKRFHELERAAIALQKLVDAVHAVRGNSTGAEFVEGVLRGDGSVSPTSDFSDIEHQMTRAYAHALKACDQEEARLEAEAERAMAQEEVAA